MKFYLIPCDPMKRPLTRNGEKDASNDPEQIKRWRQQYPGCNFAIATGPSGLIALDEDCHKEAFVEGCVERACGVSDLANTVEWRSGRGGRVRLFKRPDGVNVPPRNGILPAVDVKASAGYVLCPPSVNAAGGRYEWVNSPKTTEVAEAPRELVEWLAKAGTIRRPVPTNTEGDAFLKAGDGRWEYLRKLGGVMRRYGCGREVLEAALLKFRDVQCEEDETLRDSEVQRIVDWYMTVHPEDAEVGSHCTKCAKRERERIEQALEEDNDRGLALVDGVWRRKE